MHQDGVMMVRIAALKSYGGSSVLSPDVYDLR